MQISVPYNYGDEWHYIRRCSSLPAEAVCHRWGHFCWSFHLLDLSMCVLYSTVSQLLQNITIRKSEEL